MTQSSPRPSPFHRLQTAGLVTLFSLMYFIQGIAEPTEGLIAQPVRSLLKTWGYSATVIGGFGALLSIPWMLKPLYGLLTDFVPLASSRRRSYLLLTTGAATAGLIGLYLTPIPPGAYGLLLSILLIPTVGVAFSDVVIDALMIEKGQPRNLTGTLQSVQWAAMYAGTLLAGLSGGWLSQHQLQNESFLFCATTSAFCFVLVLLFIREPVRESVPQHRMKAAVRELAGAVRTPQVIASAAFLFLWSFNPFSSAVLYLYLTEELQLSEQDFGFTTMTLSAGAILGSLSYGLYCRRISLVWMIHLSILMGALSTLAYCLVQGLTSAFTVSLLVGLTYMTGSMVQLDLAARSCPVHTAGTTFATLMALSNFSLSLSSALGGWLYDHWSHNWGPDLAFQLLVVTGALFTSLCWLIVPLLLRSLPAVQETESTTHDKAEPLPDGAST